MKIHFNFLYRIHRNYLIAKHGFHTNLKKSSHIQLQVQNEHVSRKTIYALSTPNGMSAMAVVRVSGPNACDVPYKMGQMLQLPEKRKAVLCNIKDPITNNLLDKGLLLWFPAPQSFTGEDVCELHIHGGIAVIKSILNALKKIPNFLHAEPGEFTRRAFLAGKLDLTEVEGLADLIHAETEVQQKQALRQMSGELNKLYNSWTSKIKRNLAQIEAYIDFGEDQHLDNSILNNVRMDILTLKKELMNHLNDKNRGEKLRNGIYTVILGEPNVGKSSLLNYLCKRDVAIVSSTAGTTRDIIETSLNLEGYLVNISDTAGVRNTSDLIEIEGIKRAKKRSIMADILLIMHDAKDALEAFENGNKSFSNFLNCILNEKQWKDFFEKPLDSDYITNNENHINNILLLNKIDLLNDKELDKVKLLERECLSVCSISLTKDLGMDKFLDLFVQKVKDVCSSQYSEEPVITRERHRNYVEKCLQNLLEFEQYLNIDIAIASETLRNAANELGKITGKFTSDEILDIIFKEFCIGK